MRHSAQAAVLFFGATCLALAMSGCSSQSPLEGQLTGDWNLSTLNGVPASDVQAGVTFSRVSGAFTYHASDGCNLLNGVAKTANAHGLTFGPGSSTLMLCRKVPFGKALRQVRFADVTQASGHRVLVLQDSKGNTIATFDDARNTPIPSADIAALLSTIDAVKLDFLDKHLNVVDPAAEQKAEATIRAALSTVGVQDSATVQVGYTAGGVALRFSPAKAFDVALASELMTARTRDADMFEVRPSALGASNGTP